MANPHLTVAQVVNLCAEALSYAGISYERKSSSNDACAFIEMHVGDVPLTLKVQTYNNRPKGPWSSFNSTEVGVKISVYHTKLEFVKDPKPFVMMLSWEKKTPFKAEKLVLGVRSYAAAAAVALGQVASTKELLKKKREENTDTLHMVLTAIQQQGSFAHGDIIHETPVQMAREGLDVMGAALTLKNGFRIFIQVTQDPNMALPRP